MADIDNRLKIKYGLDRDPTPSERRAWADHVAILQRQGLTAEEAGQRAARLYLPGYGTRFYASEADTIEMLLRSLKD